MTSYSWTAPDGTVANLSDRTAGYWAASGIKGIGPVAPTFAADARYRGGESIRRITLPPRMITLPLVVEGATEAEFVDTWRQIGWLFAASNYAGPGQFAVTRPDGTTRTIGAYYAGGYDHDPDLGITSDVMVLSLRCPLPWWHDTAAVTVVSAYDPGIADFLSPYPQVSPGDALGAVVVTNPGAEVWPSWTVTGPASEIIASSATTGESWTLTPSDPSTGHGDLAAGESVQVDTDPPAVYGPSGENWAGALDWPTAALWSLKPGDNEITYQVTGAGVGTTITMTYVPRHEMA